MEVETYTHQNVIVTNGVVLIDRIVEDVYDNKFHHYTSHQRLISDGVQELDVSFIPLDQLYKVLNIQ